MPTYVYSCSDCKIEFEIRHSMSFDEQRCIECGSENTFKIPHLQSKKSSISSKIKAGKVVDSFIEDAKKEVKQEKLKLKSKQL